MEKTILFLDKQIRTVWDNKNQIWMFSVIDIIATLTRTSNPRRYWSDLKRTIKTSTDKGNRKNTEIRALRKIVQFKLAAADGKMRFTDVASSAALLRIIQLIPSPKAKPLKEWLKSTDRGVTMLPEPLKNLTEPKPNNRLFKVCATEGTFLILSTIEKFPEEKAVKNETINIKDSTQKSSFTFDTFFSAYFPAYLSAFPAFPWSVRFAANNQLLVQPSQNHRKINKADKRTLTLKYG